MTYIIGLEKGQLHVRTPQNNVYHVGIHNEPSLEDIFTRHGLPEFCEFSRSVDSPEKNGVPKDYNAREAIARVCQGMLPQLPTTLNKLYDDCFREMARMLEAQGKDPLMSEIRELALADFIRRGSTVEQGQPTKPEHMKQDTPTMQAVAIIAGIEGWVSNLLDGISQPERAAEAIQRGLEDLKILCGAKRGQPDGWLRKTW